LLACALALLAGCGSVNHSATVEADDPAQAVARATAPEADAVAKKLLGPDAKVLFSGDLAHNGHQQILVMNPTSPPSGDIGTGVAFHRAAVLERQGARWNEVLLCDEYLKNPAGFLSGTPRQPVAGWKVQLRPAAANTGRELRFTPLAGGGEAIQVAWNPKVNRYQSFVTSGGASGVTMEQDFLEEMPIIETPTSELR